MKLSRRFLRLFVAGQLLIGAVALAQTNTTATVSGVVTDPQGNLLANAMVVLTNNATRVPSSSKTNGAGIYRITGLLPGNYGATVAHDGFRSTVRNDIELHVEDQVSMDFSLQVGSASESVTVEAGAPMIETESDTIGQVIESRTILEQPLNGRNVYDLIALAPGVVAGGGTGQQAAMSQIWALNNYQIGGGFGNQSSTYLDGAPLNVAYARGTGLTPTQDSIVEFKIESNNVGPEYGNTGGGIVTMATKSGSDAFHGSAYEFIRNKVLDANTYFGNHVGLSRPPFTQNEYGVTLGGPIIKKKAFFFFSWENFALRQGNTLAITVPTDAERKGDFSASNFNPIYDPCADPSTGPSNVNANNTCISVPGTRTQFPGNVIPSSRLDPTALATEKAYYPEPNGSGVNNYINNYSTGVNWKQFVARVDGDISSKHHAFLRYTFSGGTYEKVVPYGTPYTGTGPEPTTSDLAVISDTYTLNQSTVLDLNISYLRFAWAIVPPFPSLDVGLFDWPAVFNTTMTQPYGPGLCINGYDDTDFMCGNSEQNLHSHNNNYSIIASLTKQLGRHTLKFGFDGERLDDNYGQSNSSSGLYDFSNGMTAIDPENPAGTGDAFASFLLGYGTGGAATQLFIPAADQYYWGIYANDQFKLTQDLTFNLGLRWEQPGAFTERHNRASVFLPNEASPLAAVTGLPLTGNFALVDSPDWKDRHNTQQHWNQFAPRVGVAYRLGAKTSIRSGFGMFFPPIAYNLLLAPGQSPVNSAVTNWVATLDGGISPYNTLHNPYPNGINDPPGHNPNFETAMYGSGPGSPIPVQPAPHVFQWNLGVQRELGWGVVLDATYAGMRATHLPTLQENINTLPDADLAQGSALIQTVPNPFYGNSAAGPTLGSEVSLTRAQLLLPYRQFTGVGATNKDDRDAYYDALQVKVQKRFSHGSTLLAAYTWEKLIANTDEMTSWSEGEAGLEGPQGDQDPQNLRGERSVSGEDVPQNLQISYVIDIPIGKGQRWISAPNRAADTLVSGWSVTGTTSFQDGFPLGISNGTPAVYGGSRPNVVVGCDKNASGSAVSKIDKWFNTACFSEPPAYSFGNEGREDSTLKAAGTNNWNIGIAKQLFTIRDRYVLNFRGEFFNAFNRVQFGPPGTSFGTAQFGVVSSQVNNPRLVQFAARLTF